MSEPEDEVQCALALIQTSIKQYGPEDTLVIACKKCTPMNSALRGHKFLKDSGFVTATVGLGTFVTERYHNLAKLLEIIKKQNNTTPRMPLFVVSDPSLSRRGSSKRSTSALSAPSTRVRVKRGAEVVQVSSSSEEQSAVEQEVYAQREQSASDDESMASSEIMNASDLRGDSEDEDSSVTGVQRRSAEQFSEGSRFLLHEQRFVHGFNARHAQQGDIMMTIKLFGATVPVPANTIVFQPWRDLEQEPDTP